ncbi:MAG: HAD family phosphatase [Chthoniobacterales bacterium]|nr:HAD family phosphatase [Chthoniobacterales bacterium]
MRNKIRLLSTDFDGTLVAHAGDPVLDSQCMQLIRDLQSDGAIWAINTGRSVDLLESGLTDFDFPCRPDFILTSERDVFRPCENGRRWEAYGDWNSRVAKDHAELFTSAASVLDDVLDFVNQNTRARIVQDQHGPEGLIAQDEVEMDRITKFIDAARETQPKFHYQRNTVYLRFCHADYHKGAALAELARLTGVPRGATFAAGDHFNDLSMLDGRYADFPACPGNAIPDVKQAVRNAGGYVAQSHCGAGVHEALLYFTS